jgi:glycosyltransferase involved in cell wall biosynthesis
MDWEKKKLLVIIPTLGGGGAERVTATMLRYLDQDKLDLTLAVVNGSDAGYKDELPSGVEYIDLGCSRVRYAFWAITKLTWRLKPDVVYSTLAQLNLMIGALRPVLYGRARYYAQQVDVFPLGEKKNLARRIRHWLQGRLFARFDGIVCEAHAVKANYLQTFPVAEDKIAIVRNPVDVERVRGHASADLGPRFVDTPDLPQGETIQFVAAGRLVPVKGFDLLIKALSLCNDPRINVTILGVGPEHDALVKLADDLNLRDRVRFIGFQENPYRYFSRADAYVLCSRLDPSPNVVLEALACQTPVIAVPAIGGIHESVDGVRDCIVAEDITAESLSVAIQEWMARPRIPVQADALARHHPAIIAKQYEELFFGSVTDRQLPMGVSQKKLLVALPSLVAGGTEHVLVTLLRHLSREQFSITLVVVNCDNPFFLDQLPEDIEVIDLKKRRVRYAMFGLLRTVRRVRPNIIFSAMGHLNFAFVLLRPFMAKGTRIVGRASDIATEIVNASERPVLWHWAYRTLYPKLDRVICQSDYMRQDLVDHFGLAVANAVVINNPVDIDVLKERAAPSGAVGVDTGMVETDEHGARVVNFLAVGRLVRAKGFDLLIEAIALLDNPAMRLTIVGEGLGHAALEEQAVAMGVADRVSLVGVQSNPYPYFADADALVISSRLDAFPNVALEALALQLPVIATPAVGSLPEILGDISGCIIAKDVSVDALAEAIRLWLAGERGSISSHAADKYRPEIIVQQYEECLLG